MNALAGLLTALLLFQAPAPPITTGRIAGRVTIEGTNTPVAAARVSFFSINIGRGGPLGPPPQTTTDSDGRFSFDRLVPGAYRIDVQKTGFAPLNSPGLPNRQPIQLAAGQTIDNLDLQLQKGAVISGKLLDATGEPLPDARVMVLRRTALGRSSAPARLFPAGPAGQTNDLGEFRIAGLASGEYYVAALPRMGALFGASAASDDAAATQRTTTTTTFYPGTTDDVVAQAITVTAGNEFNNVVFTIQTVPAFRVSGIVVDEAGAPVPGAMVMLFGDQRGGVFLGPIGGDARSGADGRFVISGIAAGTYRLNATAPLREGAAGAAGGVFGFVSGGVSGPGSNEPPNQVVVTDGDVRGARVTVRKNR